MNKPNMDLSTSKSKTILIVDDSAPLRAVVSTTLTAAGYQVIEADDGTSALPLLDGRKIHLIISDIYMPQMDGLSFVAAARQLPAYKFVPMMMLTKEATDEKMLVAQQLGAKAWLVKPFVAAQLLKAVARLLH
jgi:two-component system chemotaxis response regulator CheY